MSKIKSKTKILLVDDERSILKTLTFILENEGFYVNAADNGYRAVEMSQTYSFDVAIVDFRLPDIDGFEVLSKITKSEKIIQIMITGYVSQINKDQDLTNITLLNKPINPREVIQIIEKRINEI